jgi:hypothetical protein
LPAAWDKIPQGVKFDIEVVCKGITNTIFSRVLQPKRNIGDRGWHNFVILLERFSGNQVSFIFSTSGSGDDLSYGWSAWGWVMLIREIPQPQVDEAVLPKKNRTDNENLVFINDKPVRYGNRKIEIINAILCDRSGNQKSVFFTNENVVIRITIKSKENFNQDVTVGCSIRNKYSVIYGMNTHWQRNDLKNIRIGNIITIDFLFCLRLGDGLYSVSPAVAIVTSNSDIEVLDRLEDHLLFKITNNKTMEGFVDLDAKITWNRE